MTAGEIVITAYITVLTAGLGSLAWRQLEALRREMADLRRDVSGEIASVRSEVGELRRELHSEVASLRSDLTQVALAVGARHGLSEG